MGFDYNQVQIDIIAGVQLYSADQEVSGLGEEEDDDIMDGARDGRISLDRLPPSITLAFRERADGVQPGMDCDWRASF